MAGGQGKPVAGAARAATALAKPGRRYRASRMGLVVAAAAFLLLTACGQKGPLYRPEEAPDAQTGNQITAGPSQIHD